MELMTEKQKALIECMNEFASGLFISIEIEEKPHNNNMLFPYFEEGSMYKGMEINKHYTLEELDL